MELEDAIEKIIHQLVKVEDPEIGLRLLYNCTDLLFYLGDLMKIDLWLLRILIEEVDQELVR